MKQKETDDFYTNKEIAAETSSLQDQKIKSKIGFVYVKMCFYNWVKLFFLKR